MDSAGQVTTGGAASRDGTSRIPGGAPGEAQRTARRDEVFRLLTPILERWWDTATALRRALPDLTRGELALLCAYVGAGFAVRAGLTRETWQAFRGTAYGRVERVLAELIAKRGSDDTHTSRALVDP